MSVNRAETDLAKLDAEIQRLRARMTMLEEQGVKLRHYIEVAREYEGAQSAAASAVTTASQPVTMAQSSSATRAAVDTAIAILRERRQPVHTRVLLDELARRGINVGGSNPVANLSGFLSRERGRLVNSRLTGWSLREWGEPPTVPGASDIAPEFTGAANTMVSPVEAKVPDGDKTPEYPPPAGLNGVVSRQHSYVTDFELDSDYDPFQQKGDVAG